MDGKEQFIDIPVMKPRAYKINKPIESKANLIYILNKSVPLKGSEIRCTGTVSSIRHLSFVAVVKSGISSMERFKFDVSYDRNKSYVIKSSTIFDNEMSYYIINSS